MASNTVNGATGDTQRAVAAWGVMLLGLLGIVGYSLVTEGTVNVSDVATYLFVVVIALAAGILPRSLEG